MGWKAVALAVALVLATGCSGGDNGARGTTGPSTTEAPSTSSTFTPATTSTVAVVTSSAPTTRPVTPTTATATTALAVAVAEAGGWRLVISHPTARATIPPAAVLCYEATGSTREPELVLEVTALPPGTVTRVPVPVGRGPARVDLGAAGVGARDLRIQLIPNGQRIDGLAVTVPVTIAAGANTATC